jgi:hypothetical protein
MTAREVLVPLVAALLGGGLVASLRSWFTLGPERGKTLAEEESLTVATLRQVIAELRELRVGDLQELARLRQIIVRLEAERATDERGGQ